ncbi:MAG: MFS transporter [Chloroflexi bacterium]|nr:MFS transporter [Chloroflexota bacterium]
MIAALASRRLSPWILVGVVAAGTFVTALDQTVVITALPAIMADLKIPILRFESVIWVVTAYLLGYTAAMPLLGRLADVHGYRRIYLLSLAVFVIGTTLVAVAGQWAWLNANVEPLHQIIAARVIQAIGGGGAVPVSLAIAAALVSPAQRGLALGVVAGAAEAGSMLGPAYGGVVIELWGWRAIFWLNLPQAAAIATALVFLPERRNPGARMDYMGAVLLTAALILLCLALAHNGLFELSSWMPWWLLAGCSMCMASLVVVHFRTAQPLLSSILLQSRAFILANAVQLLVGVSLVVAMASTVIMANTVMNVPDRPVGPFTAALWLLRMTATIPVGAVVGGLLLRRFDARRITVVGLGLIATGMLRLSGWQIDIAEPRLTIDMVLAGAGFGLVVAPLMHGAIASARADYRAVAASMIVVARMLGMTLGIAVLSAWGINQMLAILTETPSPLTMPGLDAEARSREFAEYRRFLQTASLDLFHAFYRAAGIIAVISIVPALLMRPGTPEGSKTVGP